MTLTVAYTSDRLFLVCFSRKKGRESIVIRIDFWVVAGPRVAACSLCVWWLWRRPCLEERGVRKGSAAMKSLNFQWNTRAHDLFSICICTPATSASWPIDPMTHSPIIVESSSWLNTVLSCSNNISYNYTLYNNTINRATDIWTVRSVHNIYYIYHIGENVPDSDDLGTRIMLLYLRWVHFFFRLDRGPHKSRNLTGPKKFRFCVKSKGDNYSYCNIILLIKWLRVVLLFIIIHDQ